MGVCDDVVWISFVSGAANGHCNKQEWSIRPVNVSNLSLHAGHTFPSTDLYSNTIPTRLDVAHPYPGPSMTWIYDLLS